MIKSATNSFSGRLESRLSSNHGPSSQSMASNGLEEPTQAFSSTDSDYQSRLAAAQGLPTKASATAVIEVVPEESFKISLVERISRLKLDPHDRLTRLVFQPMIANNFELRTIGMAEKPAGRLKLQCISAKGEETAESIDLLAISQSVQNIGCQASCRVEGTDVPLRFCFYFDPMTDDVTLQNHSNYPIFCRSGQSELGSTVYPRTTTSLHVGVWDVLTTSSKSITQVLVRPRFYLLSDQANLEPKSRKRNQISIAPANKRTNVASSRHRLQISKPVPRMVSTAVVQESSSQHPFTGLEIGEKVELVGSNLDETFSIAGIEKLSQTRSSSVWRAMLSIMRAGQDCDLPLVAKVLTRHGRPELNAKMWLREARIHSRLNADKRHTIIQLVAVDARLHCFYTENIEAVSLAAKVWRTADDFFTGSRGDAIRIFKDITSALDFIHGNGIVHNDIKPGNVLYNRARGAVVLDFGLSYETEEEFRSVRTAGTPWYVPPEFLIGTQDSRGPPGDIWAEGVLMLFVLKYIGFPEKGPEWQLAAVGDPHDLTASSLMTQWVESITKTRRQVDNSKLGKLIQAMVEPSREQRIRTDALFKASLTLED
ncbi:kinase-like domain-containing protein [Xylariales sp. PMI_506]|nr:kinase-like domain-containing protein [Xylariales sp. PMI_506]